MLKVYCTLKKKNGILNEIKIYGNLQTTCQFLSCFVFFLFALFITTKVRALLFIYSYALEHWKQKWFFCCEIFFPLECIKLRSQIYLINQFRFNSCRTCRKFAFRLVKYLFTLRHIIRTRYLFIIFLKF